MWDTIITTPVSFVTSIDKMGHLSWYHTFTYYLSLVLKLPQLAQNNICQGLPQLV